MESDVFSLFIAGLLNAMTPSNLLVMIIGLVFVTYVPDITLLLPKLLGYVN